MGLFSGWQSAVSSAAQVVANLVGQDIVAKSITLSQASGSNAVTLTTGARLKLGGGTTDYMTSDGTTGLSTAGNFAVGGNMSTFTLGTNQFISFGTNSYIDMSAGAGLRVANKTAINATAPTISSGFGTSPSIAGSNGAFVFTVNVGGGGVATSGVITMPAAANGWVVLCTNTTTPASGNLTKMSANTTTSVTLTNYTNAGAATAWAANDVIGCIAVAY